MQYKTTVNSLLGKALLVIAVSIFLLQSCKKNDSSSNNNSTKCSITKIAEDYGNGRIDTLLFVMDNSQVVRIEERNPNDSTLDYNTIYTYNSDGNIERYELNYPNNNTISSIIRVYQYTGVGTYTTYDYSVDNNTHDSTLTNKDVYTYSNGQITKDENYDGSGQLQSYTNYGGYTNGNATVLEQYVNGTLQSRQNITYDTNTRLTQDPTTKTPAVSAVNNPTKDSSSVYYNGQFLGSSVLNFTYMYNSDGLVTHLTLTSINPYQSTTQNKDIIYNCQ